MSQLLSSKRSNAAQVGANSSPYSSARNNGDFAFRRFCIRASRRRPNPYPRASRTLSPAYLKVHDLFFCTNVHILHPSTFGSQRPPVSDLIDRAFAPYSLLDHIVSPVHTPSHSTRLSSTTSILFFHLPPAIVASCAYTGDIAHCTRSIPAAFLENNCAQNVIKLRRSYIVRRVTSLVYKSTEWGL
jgi:hypothetical protein